MATAKDYPITTGYGCIAGYPLNPCKPGYGMHRGIDRAMPTGTSVAVNGVVIGLSGNTGASTGPHLHTGKWIGAQVQDPGNGGFTFASAVVKSTGNDSSNGNYVRLEADGAEWVYLHLSKINVSAGQVLKEINVNALTERDVKFLFTMTFHRDPTYEEEWKHWVGRTLADWSNQQVGHPEYKNITNLLKSDGQYEKLPFETFKRK